MTFPVLVPNAKRFPPGAFDVAVISSTELSSTFSDFIIFWLLRSIKSIVPESVTANTICWYSSTPIRSGFLELKNFCDSILPVSLPSAPNHSGKDSQKTKTRIATTATIVAIPPK